MSLNPKICEVIDMIDSSLNWSLSEDEKDKKIAVYHIGLEGISDEQINTGLIKQLQLNSREFPTPGQFRSLCNPIKRPELKLLTFEKSVKDNELNKANSNKILKTLGADFDKKGKFLTDKQGDLKK